MMNTTDLDQRLPQLGHHLDDERVARNAPAPLPALDRPVVLASGAGGPRPRVTATRRDRHYLGRVAAVLFVGMGLLMWFEKL